MTNRAWQDDAACLNHVQVFFPRTDNPADTATAKKICGICPVKTACLDDALDMEVGAEESRAGIRGGKTPKQRANLARTRRRKARAAA